VRHAQAEKVTVGVRVDGGRLTLTVTDDGIGTDPDQARGGLVNLRERAAGHDGTFEIGRAEPRGTALCWSVPLRD
jgi:two-component system, NarL family, sensor histidine kinase DevS